MLITAKAKCLTLTVRKLNQTCELIKINKFDLQRKRTFAKPFQN